MAVAIFLLSLQ